MAAKFTPAAAGMVAHYLVDSPLGDYDSDERLALPVVGYLQYPPLEGEDEESDISACVCLPCGGVRVAADVRDLERLSYRTVAFVEITAQDDGPDHAAAHARSRLGRDRSRLAQRGVTP